MELVTVKLLVLTLSGVVRLFFGMFPLVVAKTIAKKWSKATDQRMKKVISILMFFGGGVLLATCFLHMMPEVRLSFAEAAPNQSFPFTEVIFLGGFFLVYLIEDIVHSIVHKKKYEKKEANLKLNGNNHHKRNVTLSSGTLTKEDNDKGLHNIKVEIITPGVTPINTTNTVAVANTSVPHNNDSSGGRNDRLNKATLSLSPSDEIRINPNHLRETKEIFCKNSVHDEIPGLSKSRCQNGTGGITNRGFVSEKFQYCDPDWWKDIVSTNSQINLLTASNCTVDSCVNPNGKNSSLNIHHSQDSIRQPNNDIIINAEQKQVHHRNRRQKQDHNHNHNHHSHMHLPMDDETIDQSIGGEIRNILIVVAISFHGVFEGMAIGLQSTETDVWYLFLAVSLHECTILFCIGVELISSKTKVCRMIMYILVVSLVSPVGIGIGIFVTEKSVITGIHQALVVGCFQGLAAGTLLYVTFFEIFQEEGRKLQRKYFHILVAILGFVLMGSLEFMEGHSHGGHSHSANIHNTTIDDHDGQGHEDHTPSGHHDGLEHNHDH